MNDNMYVKLKVYNPLSTDRLTVRVAMPAMASAALDFESSHGIASKELVDLLKLQAKLHGA